MQNIFLTPKALRNEIRSGKFQGTTSGLCPGYVQCNLVILPQIWAQDFAKFCHANPKPCPILAQSEPGLLLFI